MDSAITIGNAPLDSYVGCFCFCQVVGTLSQEAGYCLNEFTQVISDNSTTTYPSRVSQNTPISVNFHKTNCRSSLANLLGGSVMFDILNHGI